MGRTLSLRYSRCIVRCSKDNEIHGGQDLETLMVIERDVCLRILRIYKKRKREKRVVKTSHEETKPDS